METSAGKALLARVLLVPGLGFVLFSVRFVTDRARWLAASWLTVMLLETWALAGHSKSMRWALIGVPLDVAHHGAAAAWLGASALSASLPTG